MSKTWDVIVVGADGGNSAVRRALFPAFQPVRLYGYREFYPVGLDLPERRFNMFTGLGSRPQSLLRSA